jgi:hypothetical protein
MNITEAQAALEAGQHITRDGMPLANSSFFLVESNGKKYLFTRTLSPRFGVRESPTSFDWDDMTATNWRVVGQ